MGINISKPSQMVFVCQYCNKDFILNSKDYRMGETFLSKNPHTWVRFYSKCPICKRDISTYIELEPLGNK